jgi:hypothetical protein
LSQSPFPVTAVVVTPRIFARALQDLDANLRARNSRLFVVKGKPLEVLPRLFSEWKVKKIVRFGDAPLVVNRDGCKLSVSVRVVVCQRARFSFSCFIHHHRRRSGDTTCTDV